MENLPLAGRHCKPCQGGITPLTSTEIQNFLKELTGGWKSVGTHHIEKEYIPIPIQTCFLAKRNPSRSNDRNSLHIKNMERVTIVWARGFLKAINTSLKRYWYTFTDFRHSLNFTNLIGQIAENEGHHPEIHLGYGKVKLLIWTHKIHGLTESDFILAAKMDQEYPISCQKACF